VNVAHIYTASNGVQ